MSDLIAGVAITIVVAVLVVLPAVLVARWQDRRQARARHCLRRPHPAVILVRDLLGLLRPAPAPATWRDIRAGMRPAPRYVDTSRTLAEMVGPIVTDAEVADEFERMPLAPLHAATEPRADVTAKFRADWERIRSEGVPLQALRDCCLATVDEPHTFACEATGRHVNGRHLGTLPRLQTPDLPPWDIGTAQQPAIDDAPVYGQAPVLVVDEARRLGQGLIA